MQVSGRTGNRGHWGGRHLSASGRYRKPAGGERPNQRAWSGLCCAVVRVFAWQPEPPAGPPPERD